MVLGGTMEEWWWKLELDVDDSSSFVASRVKNGGGIELELEVESSSYCVARTIRRGIESESISSLGVISEDAELDDELWSSSRVNSRGGMLEVMDEVSAFGLKGREVDGEGSSRFGSFILGEGGWFREYTLCWSVRGFAVEISLGIV